MKKNPKVLFVLKRREDYNPDLHQSRSMKTGLANSVAFLEDMLYDMNIKNRVAIVVDNNSIDREVHQFKPTHVVIEALWVVPTKFAVLNKLHPNVTWIVRLHSELPFIANEGIAMEWIIDYLRYKNVFVAANSVRMQRDLIDYAHACFKTPIDELKTKIIFLPNYYPCEFQDILLTNKDVIDIASFGAVRPLKNQLIQAQAALSWANENNKKLRFHINAGRIEQKGQPVLNNLKGMFIQAHAQGHELVCHDWLDRPDFLKQCGEMDIGLQVSLSETFNIVAADYISQGTALIGSREIPWIFRLFAAKPTSTASIKRAIAMAYRLKRFNVYIHRFLLRMYCVKTKKIWSKYLQGEQI